MYIYFFTGSISKLGRGMILNFPSYTGLLKQQPVSSCYK